MQRIIELADESATSALGHSLARLTPELGQQGALTVHLRGELGAGKSTLSRAWLRGLDVAGAIKSPTYALIEAYELDNGTLLHLDLYRLSSADELEYLGLDAYLAHARLALIEWPERAANRLPPPDLALHLQHAPNDGRVIALDALTDRGAALLASLE